MFEELASSDPKVKYGTAKQLLKTSREDPATLYPHFEFFKGLLDNPSNILKWTAIGIIGNLSSVDFERQIPVTLPKLYSLLNCGKMITANNTISTLATIARTCPEHSHAITDELLRVEHYNYDTEECRNIALGYVLTGISSYISSLSDKSKVIELAQRQTGNTRNATAKKAQAFLKKHGDAE